MAKAEFKRIRQKPIFQEIITQIEEMIVSGNLKAGDLLPPERQLAEIMGVNRHTVREALKVLEYMGVVNGKTGIGTIINNVGQDFLVHQIAMARKFSPREFLFELMELRNVLEPSIAALAAERATAEELAEMAEAMNGFESDLKSGQLTDADMRLHLALAKATHNSTFVRLTEPILSMQSEYRERGLKVKGRRGEVFKEHKMIYEAVRRRKPAEAREAMAYHLSKVKAMLDASNE